MLHAIPCQKDAPSFGFGPPPAAAAESLRASDFIDKSRWSGWRLIRNCFHDLNSIQNWVAPIKFYVLLRARQHQSEFPPSASRIERERCCLRITLDYIIPGKIGNIRPALLSNNNNFPTPQTGNARACRGRSASFIVPVCVFLYPPDMHSTHIIKSKCCAAAAGKYLHSH